MQQQTIELSALSDIELTAFRLENQSKFQVAKHNLEAIENEEVRRVRAHYQKLEKERPKDASIGKSPNGADKQVAQEKVNEWLDAIAVKNKKEAEAQQEMNPKVSASE